jgi:hypothetical protein
MYLRDGIIYSLPDFDTRQNFKDAIWWTVLGANVRYTARRTPVADGCANTCAIPRVCVYKQRMSTSSLVNLDGPRKRLPP